MPHPIMVLQGIELFSVNGFPTTLFEVEIEKETGSSVSDKLILVILLS